jgi:hypothetical protein
MRKVAIGGLLTVAFGLGMAAACAIAMRRIITNWESEVEDFEKWQDELDFQAE